MEDGTQTDAMNPWGVALFRTLRAVEPRTAGEQAAYSKWLDQRLDREAARGARPQLPGLVRRADLVSADVLHD
jgi:hypothetical protein